MNYFLLIGCVVCGWAMLRVLGAERMAMVRGMEAELRKEQKSQSATPVLPHRESETAKTSPAKAGGKPVAKH